MIYSSCSYPEKYITNLSLKRNLIFVFYREYRERFLFICLQQVTMTKCETNRISMQMRFHILCPHY
ncbi:hypothetical protein C4181_19060 [Clostridioides difficile]|nr:hypothetical protein [Clostridioides difficile]